MEPGAQQQTNGTVEEAQEKLMDQSTTVHIDCSENNEKMSDGKEVSEEETRLISGTSPKPEKRETSEKEAKENEQQKEQIPEEKPLITP